MIRRVDVLAGVLALLLSATTAAAADPIGPACFLVSPAAFGDTLVLFVSGNGGNQFLVTGRDLIGDRPITGTGVLTGSTFRLGFTIHPVNDQFLPAIAGAVLNVNASPISGSGRVTCLPATCGDFDLTLVSAAPPMPSPALTRRPTDRTRLPVASGE